MDISKFDKAQVLATLYNASKVQGMGILQARQGQMTVDQAREILTKQTYFDYLFGKVMKIDLSKDDLQTGLYNRDNGTNAAEDALANLTPIS